MGPLRRQNLARAVSRRQDYRLRLTTDGGGLLSRGRDGFSQLC
jgi:hypothetical protein